MKEIHYDCSASVVASGNWPPTWFGQVRRSCDIRSLAIAGQRHTFAVLLPDCDGSLESKQLAACHFHLVMMAGVAEKLGEELGQQRAAEKFIAAATEPRRLSWSRRLGLAIGDFCISVFLPLFFAVLVLRDLWRRGRDQTNREGRST